MVKKISAIILALVLCLSVVMLPANAAGFDESYVFADGKTSAFRLELDKSSYNKGDTVTVSVYLRLADEAAELKSSYLTFALNSALFDKTDAANATINTAVACDTWEAYWKSPASSLWAWVNATVTGRIQKAASAEEKALYDTYLRVSLAQDIDKVTDTKHGVVAGDINAETAPLLTFSLKLRDDIPDGTTVNIAMSEAALKCTPVQTSLTFFTNPGNATTSKAAAAATYDVSAAVASATVGAVAPAAPVLTKASSQVKMTATSASTVADAFQFRVISSISDADWNTYFANTGKAGATANAITNVGFVAYKGTAGFNLDTAKAAVAGTAADGYQVATTDYIQHADGTDAKFGCRIDITSAETRSDVTYVAFAQYLDASGAAQVVFYETSYEALLATNYTGIVAAYLAAFPFAG